MIQEVKDYVQMVMPRICRWDDVELKSCVEWFALLDEFDESDPAGLRDKALFSLVRNAGLSISHVVEMEPEDLEPNPPIDRPARPTSAYTRRIDLPQETERLQQAWLKERKALGLEEVQYGFCTLEGTQLESTYLGKRGREKTEAAGIKYPLRPKPGGGTIPPHPPSQ